ncbi:hypothetical protein TGP89_316410 [Toxoplasma gondii p89]|uniref:Uncharacterized protein n=1 Tax=Toxoplasma gondii p89 TaxID=943119 RepID=A0A086KY13_TOXGO|nr:hypothetical protein TGP89_316410 [Toxoplasma gondii p89]
MVCLTADFIRQCKRGDFSAKRCRPTSLRTKPAIHGERLLPAVTSDISSSSHPEDTTGDTGTSFLARGRAHTETVRSRCEFETYEEAYTVASTFSQRQEGVTKTREQSTKNQNRSLAHLSHLHLNYRNIDSIASETALELPNLQVNYIPRVRRECHLSTLFSHGTVSCAQKLLQRMPQLQLRHSLPFLM